MYKITVIQEEEYEIEADCEQEAIEIVDEGHKKPVRNATSYKIEEIEY